MTNPIPLPVILFPYLAAVLSFSSFAGWNASDDEDESAAALQLEGDHRRGQAIYESCAVCHMPEGWGTPNGAYPQIAGQHRSVVIKQLADIRANNRDNPSMYPFAIPEEIGGVQAIADVAVYIENLKMTGATGKGPGVDLDHGKGLYQDHCTECHGKRGEGEAEKAYPLIQGQHYHYLLRQLKWIKNGKRRNANKQMMKTIRDFGQRDLEALADYVSRMITDEDKSTSMTWKDRKRE
ncbi:MAG: c-type cytochrome [Candidatus Thiodiazotropha lotti]|uniref:c-type cytochrome n=1 Tax=Candidatus Thiodiazotropha endoloripes TaxID=1818881 RepID=UPI001F2423C1|nr:c-type cytochrome [Candidatus Thiodiazotropha endoloripes]MCG7914128.1 c-type cytochrome [Candidatus Thiodiazotropha weberae]MCG7991624.1 c-type cytochrome [Candidatus Thiodiazotropha lotti]MCG7999648.1 c-type cytochrome [Candidatus Thiodiazotropha lotti]MCW4183279.1 c-type cytochrome [Candidatus Thiodiazotropha weberae]MCW4191416.1 c-type cytochrome [Candidatus Thiodiazotropha weberae]